MSLLTEELFRTCKGGITPAEGELLATLAREVRRGCIVEVGSFRGLSALALAQGVRENPNRPQIYCIEPHRLFRGVYGGEFGPADREAFFAAMIKTGAFAEVALINLTSEEVAPAWRLPLGLLFIDGDHRYSAVRRDIDLWDPHLITGATVAFDDTKDKKGGPHRVVCELIDTQRYRQVGGVGKVSVLKKIARRRFDLNMLPSRPQRLLVACDNLVFAGGLIRFERVAKILRRWGHNLSFVSLAEAPKTLYPVDVPLLSLAEANDQFWDAVMVPGAGFPPATIEGLKTLRAPNFGIRVQHILNDQSRRDSFRAANISLAPQIVIFNNDHWPAGSFTDFKADRFHVLLGGVDANRFRPQPYRLHPLQSSQWVIGGLANKNPTPLIDALKSMPPGAKLRLFGRDPGGLTERHRDLIADGRLELVGPLFGANLERYYDTVDCVAMTERAAGWSNLVAEAMASGVPVVCTRHGTRAFANEGESALIVETISGAGFAERLQQLRDDRKLCQRLTIRAREIIQGFSWEEYTAQLLSLIQHDGRRHYIHAPEEGLFGKWLPADRLQGLQPLLKIASGLRVADFGAAEGTVAREFLRSGASLVHGFDLDPDRVGVANSLASESAAEFMTADLSDWDTFLNAHGNLIREGYDIVLHLGLHQHLPSHSRVNVLRKTVQLAHRYVAFRAPTAVYQSDEVENVLREEGFLPMTGEVEKEPASYLGPCHLFLRP